MHDVEAAVARAHAKAATSAGFPACVSHTEPGGQLACILEWLHATREDRDAALADLTAAVDMLRESYKSDRAVAWLREYDART